MFSPLIIAVAVFLAVALITVAGYYLWQKGKSEKTQSERFTQATSAQVQEQSTQEIAIDGLIRDRTISAIPWLDELFRKYFGEKVSKVMHLIEQTGVSIKVGEFILIVLLIGFAGALIGKLITGIPFIGFVAAYLPFSFLEGIRKKRIEQFTVQLPTSLDMLSNNLRAGMDIQAALKNLSDELKPPISEEFGRVVTEVNLGLTLNQAIDNLAARIDTMDVQLLCTGIIINKDYGGNLSELISSISGTVRERYRLKGIINSLTAESKMSCYLLIGLPIAMFLLLMAMSPSIYGTFPGTPLGQKILIGCAISMTIGYLVIAQMSKLEG